MMLLNVVHNRYRIIGTIILFWGICSGSVAAHIHHKKPMNILMVVGSFPVIHDICVLNQITGLIDRGHKVEIFAFSPGDFSQVQEDVIKYDLVNKTIFKKLPKSLDKYDVIVFQFGHRLFDVKKIHKFKGKVAVCLRGYDITVFLKNNPHAYNQYFDSCDLFMPVCHAFKKILEKEGCDPRKIVVQHSAIDCSKFIFHEKTVTDNRINIMSAGRFVEKKGLIYAITALAQIVKKYPNVRYTLIGDGVLKEKYNDLIQKLNVADAIKIVGWHTHKKYIQLLDTAHVFILPSVTAENNDQEGIPNVLKEAMAMGILVVATDHSGNAELIQDGVSGFLVPERNSQAIYNVIENILHTTDQWGKMQRAAVEKVHKEFDKEKENDKLEAILYKLIRHK